MKYFKQLNLQKYNLLEDLSSMISSGKIQWHNNQISINTIVDHSKDYTLGCGSLALDWKNAQRKTNSVGINKVTVHRKEDKDRLYERDFVVLCDQFRATIFEDVYNMLTQKYAIGRIRLIKLPYKTCMTWHKDPDHQVRLHYPIVTAEGNFMVIGDELHHMPQDTWWQTDTSVGHTAFNSSRQDRIHLVAVVL